MLAIQALGGAFLASSVSEDPRCSVSRLESLNSLPQSKFDLCSCFSPSIYVFVCAHSTAHVYMCGSQMTTPVGVIPPALPGAAQLKRSLPCRLGGELRHLLSHRNRPSCFVLD